MLPPGGCTDGVKNQDETDQDCGGAMCKPCSDGKSCSFNSDCEHSICSGGKCISCQDGLKNGEEGGVDCGGKCWKCPDDKSCKYDHDCQSNECQGNPLLCQPLPLDYCGDLVQNFGETDVDCASSGCMTCNIGQKCKSGTNLVPGACKSNTCGSNGLCQPYASLCFNGVKDAGETDVDCGGSCPKCAKGKYCGALGWTSDSYCLSNNCDPFVCANSQPLAPSCKNGKKDADETDVDCGNPMGGYRCLGCPNGKKCKGGTDCNSQNCVSKSTGQGCNTSPCADGICQAYTGKDRCSNGVKDAIYGETDVDCGGSCPRCPAGKSCGTMSGNCESNNCVGGVCQAVHSSCTNNNLDLDETDVDCGGKCSVCPLEKKCKYNYDCLTGVCGASGGVLLCQGSCYDGVKNSGESDVDCGANCGSKRCAADKQCTVNSDCISNLCSGGICQGGVICTDKKQNAYETDVDCGGITCSKCGLGKKCKIGSDCSTEACKGGFCGY